MHPAAFPSSEVCIADKVNFRFGCEISAFQARRPTQLGRNGRTTQKQTQPTETRKAANQPVSLKLGGAR